MNTGEKVIALLRFYSKRYDLSPTDWLEGLIELEDNPRGGEASNGAKSPHIPPYQCPHCGKRTQYGMGAARPHTNAHKGCSEEHRERVLNGTQ